MPIIFLFVLLYYATANTNVSKGSPSCFIGIVFCRNNLIFQFSDPGQFQIMDPKFTRMPFCLAYCYCLFVEVPYQRDQCKCSECPSVN